MLLETITAGQLVAHAIGDYVLQSDWMASRKAKDWSAACAHALVYALPFLLLTRSPSALMVIAWSHAIIDHWRLARFVCYAKNFLAPPRTVLTWELGAPHSSELEPATWTRWWHPWSECRGTGYHESRPPHLADWLMIICDNVLHVLCNAIALAWFA